MALRRFRVTAPVVDLPVSSLAQGRFHEERENENEKERGRERMAVDDE